MSNWLPITVDQHWALAEIFEGLYAEILKHCDNDGEDVHPEWQTVSDLAERLERVHDSIEAQDVRVTEPPGVPAK